MLERQRIGIEKAKIEGKYKGRKPLSTKKKDEIKQLLADNTLTKAAIAEKVKVGIATVYRVKSELSLGSESLSQE